MFGKLFAKSGLSLDRLRALVEVGASGSIVRAAVGDPARQSQYSRQIKELEDFFEIPLVERHGKNIRLTASGRELARISRFFLLGLSNFQRGCLAEGQSYRIGASATFNQLFLLPLLAQWTAASDGQVRFIVETAARDEVERRLHELTLDFGVVTQGGLSRPLQTRELGRWRQNLWVPRRLSKTPRDVASALKAGRLPIACAGSEVDLAALPGWERVEPALLCQNSIEARALLEGGRLAALLPDFLAPDNAGEYHCLPATDRKADTIPFLLAWNPRLLRLNPHASRRRDALSNELREVLVRACLKA
jgi:DNA-binding transcriptional LysR family regulator